MSDSTFVRRTERFREVAETDVGTPLWFIILMAIFTIIITISIIGIFATNNKIKKGAGFKDGGTHTNTSV